MLELAFKRFTNPCGRGKGDPKKWANKRQAADVRPLGDNSVQK